MEPFRPGAFEPFYQRTFLFAELEAMLPENLSATSMEERPVGRAHRVRARERSAGRLGPVEVPLPEEEQVRALKQGFQTGRRDGLFASKTGGSQNRSCRSESAIERGPFRQTGEAMRPGQGRAGRRRRRRGPSAPSRATRSSQAEDGMGFWLRKQSSVVTTWGEAISLQCGQIGNGRLPRSD